MNKRYSENSKKVDREKRYTLEEALQVLASLSAAKFDETVDLSIRLGIDPKQTDQMVRGTSALPHGTGKSVRVIVFAKGEKADEANEAGADTVGAEDLVEKVNKGWLEFDKAIATPDMMGQVGKLGKVLGPRGLMPNPKLGTVTQNVAKAVKELKAGRVEFKMDKTGIVHVSVGKKSFESEKLRGNIQTLVEDVIRAKPQAAKGNYLRSLTLSTTMSPGIKLDMTQFM